MEGVLKREVNGGTTAAEKPKAPFVQKTYDMGEPKIPMDKIWEFLTDEDAERYAQLQDRLKNK